MKKIFTYLEPLWIGSNKQISIRRTLSLVFSINLIINISVLLEKIEGGKSYADVAMILGIEAGLIAALLSLTTYSSLTSTKQRNHDRSENFG